ncbi:hypothetical protein BG005_006445 [Podila minutissima]|nr:hypothetical protein BG005_006445 [Podila minutissima]
MADEGNSDVANHLGYMYMTGSKVPVNETEALKWFLLAAKDHADAQNTMGLHYYDTNPIAAEEWFLKAAKQGYRKARSNLGQLMFSQGRHDKAEEWFRKLASSGDAHAQYCLGEMYFRGWYVVQDDTEALRLFNKAAVQGHMDAEHSLGYLYQHGRGTRRDGEEAEKWYLKALEQGHIASRKHIEEMRNYKATMYDPNIASVQNADHQSTIPALFRVLISTHYAFPTDGMLPILFQLATPTRAMSRTNHEVFCSTSKRMENYRVT